MSKEMLKIPQLLQMFKIKLRKAPSLYWRHTSEYLVLLDISLQYFALWFSWSLDLRCDKCLFFLVTYFSLHLFNFNSRESFSLSIIHRPVNIISAVSIRHRSSGFLSWIPLHKFMRFPGSSGFWYPVISFWRIPTFRRNILPQNYKLSEPWHNLLFPLVFVTSKPKSQPGESLKFELLLYTR